MITLEQLMVANKVTKHSRHNYTCFYEKYLEDRRSTANKILEIGVDTGVSIKVWLDYFTHAHIYGMDITFNPLPPGSFNNNSRVTLFAGDQGNINHLNQFIDLYGENYDIIIDDGGHTMRQQQLTFKTYFKYLKPGGIYVIEDLHTSYLTNYPEYGGHNTPVTTLGLMNHLQNKLNDSSFSTEFISVEELNELKKEIQFCKVEKYANSIDTDPLNNSEISFIIKK